MFIIYKIQAIQRYTKKVTNHPKSGNKMLISGAHPSKYPSKDKRTSWERNKFM